MFKSLALTAVAFMTFAPAWAQEAPAAGAAAAPQLTAEEVATKFRNELQAARADVISKELTLTAEQAAGFWPLFKEYQTEQNAIIDAQIKATQAYADSYAKLTEADSLAYIRALLECDGKAQALRTKWLTKFQSAVPAGTAGRVIQIDRQLSLIGQANVASGIPLVR
jgi:Spy/CpxP family protein refolding chaperone